jgi:hypothetical protein
MRNRVDVWAGVVLCAVGIGTLFEAFRLKVGTFLAPKPGFFPLLGGLVLIGFSLGLLVQIWMRRGRASGRNQEPLGELRRPLILVTSMGIYAAVLDPLGYLLPTFVISALILRMLDVKSWKGIILASLGLSVASYLLFGRILGIELPSGDLPFLG